MKIKNIPAPEIYKSSADFRFFLKWFDAALEKTQYDTENLIDLYDPLRCPEDLLWMLADTMGFKYDNRLPAAFNRLVLLYFMSMIYHRGSRNGMILAAETNLAQFMILQDGANNEELYNRLENTAIPNNAVSVIPHTAEGYIDVVYFSTKLPKDACVEYVRPLGMFTFQRPGVEFSAKTKISIDVELTNLQNTGMDYGPTQVGHYRRADYASLQQMKHQGNTSTSVSTNMVVDDEATRSGVWNRNPKYERTEYPNGMPLDEVNPGYRALYSLQLSNNENIVQALIDPVFTLGSGPFEMDITYPDDYYKATPDAHSYNLRYDEQTDLANTKLSSNDTPLTYEVEGHHTNPKYEDMPIPMPAINPIMSVIGDAISLNILNTEYYGEDTTTSAANYLYETVGSSPTYTVNLIQYISTFTKIVTPDKIDGITVDIFRGTTFNYTPVVKVTIPEGVTDIE